MDFETWFDTLTITDGIEYMSIIKEVASKAFEAGQASQLTPVAGVCGLPVSHRETFQEAVANDPEMTPAQKAYWLSQPAPNTGLEMSAAIDGNDLVIRLPLSLLIWSQFQREESIVVYDKVEMGKWLAQNILEYGGDAEIGSTAIEQFLDSAFMDAIESGELWLAFFEYEEDSDGLVDE